MSNLPSVVGDGVKKGNRGSPPEARPRMLSRRRFLRAAAGIGGFLLAGCGAGGPAGGGRNGVSTAGGAPGFRPGDLAGLVLSTSMGVAGQTLLVDLGELRVLGAVNFAAARSGCRPHHFTMIPTEDPHAGFYGLQTCNASHEAFILEYVPRDQADPRLGGEFRIRANLTERYGVKANHHAVLKPDRSLWAVSDDRHDLLTFISTREPYEPLRAWRWLWDEGRKVSTPVEVRRGQDGRYRIPTPEQPFGPHRCDFGAWTPDGRWFVEGHRSTGVLWVVDGNTLDVVHALQTAEGGAVEPVDPADIRRGVRPGGRTTITHGAGVTNDSRYLLVNDVKGNATVVFDIADPDPRRWREHKRIRWPGEGVYPYSLQFSPDGSKALVSLRAYDLYKPGVGATAVVDARTFEVIRICELPGFLDARGIAVTPDGRYFIQAYSGWDTSGGGHVVWSLDTLEPVLRLPTGVGVNEAVLVQTSKITHGC